MNILVKTITILALIISLGGCTFYQVSFGPDRGQDYIYKNNYYGYFPINDNTIYSGFGWGNNWGNRYYWRFDNYRKKQIFY